MIEMIFIDMSIVYSDGEKEDGETEEIIRISQHLMMGRPGRARRDGNSLLWPQS